MKALLAALLLAAGLLCPCAEAQQDDAARKQFLEYKAKAEQGNLDAQYIIGLSWINGEGVEKDFVEAVKWFRKAAEQGDVNAQYLLGLTYASGKDVAKDYAEAYAWLNLAAAADPRAGKDRDALEKKMTPQQVADAQKRTRELRAMIEANAKAKAGK